MQTLEIKGKKNSIDNLERENQYKVVIRIAKAMAEKNEDNILRNNN